MQYVAEFRERGFAVIRAVFGPADISALGAAFDAVKAAGAIHAATFRHGNFLHAVSVDPQVGPVVRFVQWAAYRNSVLARVRSDARLLRLIEPLVGPNLKQVTNTMIWKPPGATVTEFAYHQDGRFRRPASAYRNVGSSAVQIAIAVDPHRPANGCMRMCAGSHRRGDLRLGITGSVYQTPCAEAALEAVGLDPEDLVDIVLEPGDVVLWHPHTVHGSHHNASDGERRSYLNAYMVAADCDRGVWAWRDGVPCDLGEPVLLSYDALFERPEPHYVEASPRAFKP